VGTWTPVSVEAFGPNPKGILIFDANGRFYPQILRSELPKIASNKRDTGTPEENKAVVSGSIAYYGTYTMNGTDLMLHVEGCSFPNWTGTDQKRSNVSVTRTRSPLRLGVGNLSPGAPTGSEALETIRAVHTRSHLFRTGWASG
jgi:Lipocalin-like domain